MDEARPGLGRGRPPGAWAGAPTVPRPRSAPLSESRPHPTGVGVVGTYVHPYDPFLQPYPSQIPSMRPARDASAGPSPTPIYDALYAEYLRSFRTLPGDRSGEEELGFRAFGTVLSTGVYGHRHAAAYPTAWSAQHGHVQAALPPGPRRGV